jgi:ABC-type polysaccharide/polyol phosphate transport system ATPase subunit
VLDGVWKKFRRGERHDSLRDLVPATIKRLIRRRENDVDPEEFWAVHDVSFEVKRGEAVGIIGPNGAGKSTALKLLTRILKPTRGHCHVSGRVGALIEVAAGFHPDLTGRENVYLQGAIMGMKRLEIQRKFDAIVDFSGVAAFIDTQVKRYSSGMQARLGFSIAAHLDPDVLFIDEVLSVGDISFQARCLDKLQEQVRAGVALVFVSHNLAAVATLCRRSIVLARGQKLFDGPVDAALQAYLKASQSTSTRNGVFQPSFSLANVGFQAAATDPSGTMTPHTRCRLSATFECLAPATPFNIGLEVERTRDLLYCYGATTEQLGQPLYECHPGDLLNVVFEFQAHFARGHYRLNLNLRDPRGGKFHLYAENAASFTVSENISYDGVTDIELECSVSRPRSKSSANAICTV